MYRTIYEKYINDLHRQLIYGVKKKAYRKSTDMKVLVKIYRRTLFLTNEKCRVLHPVA